MAASSSAPLEASAAATPMPGVYIVPLHALDPDAVVHFIDGRPVTAIAAHPTVDDLVYVTTATPELLTFLSEQVQELGP